MNTLTGQIPPLLQVRDLTIIFHTPRGIVKALDRVSFELGPAEILGLVGESGSGKTVTVLSILRLIPEPPGQILEGEIWFDQRDLLRLTAREMRDIRGKRIALIFQDPTAALNPVLRIGDQISEVLTHHLGMKRKEAWQVAASLLERVGIAAAEKCLYEYPHQLSGGMRQRVMIAMALACRPSIILADEPTTALDVTIQAQILQLLRRLREEFSTSMIFISHDLAVIAQIAQRVIVMYAGQIMEKAPVDKLFSRPAHPYTQSLLDIVSGYGPDRQKGGGPPRGRSGRMAEVGEGCCFWQDCPKAELTCQRHRPRMIELEDGHWVACHHPS